MMPYTREEVESMTDCLKIEKLIIEHVFGRVAAFDASDDVLKERRLIEILATKDGRYLYLGIASEYSRNMDDALRVVTWVYRHHPDRQHTGYFSLSTIVKESNPIWMARIDQSIAYAPCNAPALAICRAALIHQLFLNSMNPPVQ